MENREKKRIGVSSCLLGENVRYDGGNKKNNFVIDTLSKEAEIISICPERECGLSIPRDPMHLEGTPNCPKLVITDSKDDITSKMESWIETKIKKLKELNLDGFILKSKSPSCGIKNISFFKNDKVTEKGMGIFAKAIIENFKDVLIVDEIDLNDEKVRGHFPNLL